MSKAGLDIGSLYIGGVVIEGDKIADSVYLEHRGDLAGALNTLLQRPAFRSFDTIGVCGNFLNMGRGVIDSSLASIEGIKFLAPGCRNVFTIGGETFSLIVFDEKGEYREHSINPPCAAGTGAFIEQQAKRLNLTVPELADHALAYTGKTPLIATRCAVFAKTDITHAMQEGYSLDAVCAGLCEGIARNVLDTLVKGREIHPPAAVTGGVSLNKKIVNAISNILKINVNVPEHSHVAGAVGAAALGTRSKLDLNSILPGDRFRKNIRLPLKLTLADYPDFSLHKIFNIGDVEVLIPQGGPNDSESLANSLKGGAFLGIDIGSTSTKAVLINGTGEAKGGFYTPTGGDPINSVRKLIKTIKSLIAGQNIEIRGSCTTGSGRKMIKTLFNADMEINEITAHAKAAVHLNPGVDTVIEIGGQDSKFTRIRDGEVYFSNMNYVCAAGTGSFIEEQAKRLGVSLEDFSELALGARAPYTSDRCTVYMERDLGVLLSENWSKEALAAAVLNSVRDNYLARVVGRSPLGDYIVFQGATARNKALAASFEQMLNKTIHVSPLCHLTGAYGAALTCLEAGTSESGFIWDISGLTLEKEECLLCANRCLLTVLSKDDVKTGWGMKCGRDYSDPKTRKKKISGPEKRFQESSAAILKPPSRITERQDITIGLPNALYNAGYMPLWHRFLSGLGYRVKVTKSSRQSIEDGKNTVNSDFCAPMIVSHGYFKQSLDDDTDFIFFPAVVNEKDGEYRGEHLFKSKTNDSYFCYYSQYLPTIISKLTSFDVSSKLISPLIFFNHRDTGQITGDLYEEMKSKLPGLEYAEVKRAYVEAMREFNTVRRRRGEVYGREERSGGDSKNIKIALLGRPYVVFDPVLNAGIPAMLEELGARVYWQDEFSIDDFRPKYANKYYERMHWHYGKRILKLAEYIARSDNLFAVYLTCFRCSPDSFLAGYVKDIMTHYNKPFLILQLDEHSSDVGYTTRVEAGIRSFKNHREKKVKAPALSEVTRARNDLPEKGDTVLIPYLDQLISRFWVNCFRKAGFQSLLLDAEEKSLNTGYQFVNGGECMPLVSIAGSAVDKINDKKLDPAKTFLYIPTSCLACNFPQFPILSDLVFKSAGLKGVKIGLINSMEPGKILPRALAIKMFESYIAGCIVYKMYNRVKPYEVKKGETDKAFQKTGKLMSDAILTGRDLRKTLSESSDLFRDIDQDMSDGRKPRIGLIGDLYVKYNEVMNQKIQSLVEELGGELVTPSMTEYPFHFYDADVRLFGDDPRHYNLLRSIERRFEMVAADIIEGQLEPDFAECVEYMEDYKIRHYITGETSINVGRALYYIKHGSVDAILHINPMFCCPGVVTSSVYRKIQEDFNIPIIDIFYDGTGNPNSIIIPHMHYLHKKRASKMASVK